MEQTADGLSILPSGQILDERSNSIMKFLNDIYNGSAGSTQCSLKEGLLLLNLLASRLTSYSNMDSSSIVNFFVR